MADNSMHGQLSAAAAVVRNPLSVIAMFVLLVEAIATLTLVQVRGESQIAVPLVWFVVLFPTVIALLFFSTLWWRHQFLYSPMEYRSDESFLTAMQRLQRVEARQEAADLNPRTADEKESLSVVDRLLRLGDLRAAVKVGRTFLEAGSDDSAERIFQHIRKHAPADHRDLYNALANLAYSEIRLGRFEQAIENLNRAIDLLGQSRAFPWIHIALAYAHFKLSKRQGDRHHTEFEAHLAKAKAHRWFADNVLFLKDLYPEIADRLD